MLENNKTKRGPTLTLRFKQYCEIDEFRILTSSVYMVKFTCKDPSTFDMCCWSISSDASIICSLPPGANVGASKKKLHNCEEMIAETERISFSDSKNYSPIYA